MSERTVEIPLGAILYEIAQFQPNDPAGEAKLEWLVDYVDQLTDAEIAAWASILSINSRYSTWTKELVERAVARCTAWRDKYLPELPEL